MLASCVQICETTSFITGLQGASQNFLCPVALRFWWPSCNIMSLCLESLRASSLHLVEYLKTIESQSFSREVILNVQARHIGSEGLYIHNNSPTNLSITQALQRMINASLLEAQTAHTVQDKPSLPASDDISLCKLLSHCLQPTGNTGRLVKVGVGAGAGAGTGFGPGTGKDSPAARNNLFAETGLSFKD